MFKRVLEYFVDSCGLKRSDFRPAITRDDDGKVVSVSLIVPWFLVHQIDVAHLETLIPDGFYVSQMKSRPEDVLESATKQYDGNEYVPSIAISKGVDVFDALDECYG